MKNDSISEKLQSRFSELLANEGKKFGQYIGIFLVIVLALIYFFYAKDEKKNPSLQLESTYYALSHATKDEVQLELLPFEQALRANPSLAPNYQGKAAQLLLEKSDPADALLLITPLFKRVSIENYPNYKEFSENTLMIAEGQLEQGLQKSIDLQKNLDNQPILQAHNLVRIAFLQLVLKDPKFSATVSNIRSILTGDASPLKEAMNELEKIYAYKNLGLIQFFDTQEL